MTAESKNNLDNARKAIETVFQDNWSETEVAYQDVLYKVSQPEWIAVNVLFSGSEGVGLVVNGQIRDWGLVLVEVFVEPNKGTSRALILGGMVREMLQEETFDGSKLHFQSGEIRRVGVAGDYLKYNVEVPFFYQG